MGEEQTHDEEFKWIFVIVFYILISFLCIGSIINFISLTSFGDKIRILLKSVPIVSAIITILAYFSAIVFPIICIYLFVRLYHRGPPGIHLFASNRS